MLAAAHEFIYDYAMVGESITDRATMKLAQVARMKCNVIREIEATNYRIPQAPFELHLTISL
jgi:hypothetical protein